MDNNWVKCKHCEEKFPALADVSVMVDHIERTHPDIDPITWRLRPQKGWDEGFPVVSFNLARAEIEAMDWQLD